MKKLKPIALPPGRADEQLAIGRSERFGKPPEEA
jgi:hypothetical protein